MKASVLKDKDYIVVLILAGVVIALLPFHALMTVWAASLFGHYTLFRLWKEFLVLIAGLIVIWWFIKDRKLAKEILRSRLSWLIAAFTVLDFIMAVVAYSNHSVSGKALAYGLLDDIRFLAFFIICWAIGLKSDYLSSRWQKFILIPALLVVLFGLLQMSVLPANFLVHFGYGPKTIPPYETINNNQNYVRILSTLRGADPLGAYMLLPISALIVLIIRNPKSWLWAKLAFLAGSLAVLYGSYSRSAWIGVILSCLLVAAAYIKKDAVIKYKKTIISATAVIILVAAGGFIVLRNNTHFQNVFFHTQSNSASPVSSDQAHLIALENGFKSLVKHPVGVGPGTSGPASVYNHYRPARIPENYFLEIGEESGWLGLTLFVLINAFVGYKLWERRESPFALALLAALVGITFVNLLSLSWTDDTLSYIWWGLAGLAMAISPKTNLLKKDRA